MRTSAGRMLDFSAMAMNTAFFARQVKLVQPHRWFSRPSRRCRADNGAPFKLR
jgi:hypothetical protein